MESVIADPRVQGVSLTKRHGAGRRRDRRQAPATKVVLELGPDPFILLREDQDAAVEAAVGAYFSSNSGQSWNGAKRFIVIDSLYDAFLEKFTRPDGRPNGPDIGRHRARPVVVARRRRGAAGSARPRGQAGCDAWSRRAASADAAPSSRPPWQTSSPEWMPTTRSSSAPSPPSTRCRQKTRRSSSRTAPRSVSVPTSTPTTEEQAMRVADKIDAGMVGINIVLPTAPSCPSVASSAQVAVASRPPRRRGVREPRS